MEHMRQRARHRLLGAAVLLLAGIVAFPLLFDTQPRTLSSKPPAVEMRDSDQLPPLPLPPMATADDSLVAGEEIVTAGVSLSAVVAPPEALPSVLQDLPDEPMSVPPPVAPQLEPILVPEPAPLSATPAQVKPPSNGQPSRPEAKKPAAKPTPQITEAERARALLEGKPVLSAEAQRVQALLEQRPVAAAKVPKTSRSVLQVGSFTDAAGAQAVREKLQKAGVNAYLEEINVGKNKRTRVRAGPFTTKEESEKMEKRIKDMGLPAVPIALP